MIALVRAGRRVQKPAAKLADIGEHGGVIFVDVVPEFGEREFPLQDHRAADHEGQSHRADPAGGVIERQRVIDAVAGFGIQRADKARHHEQHAHMAEIRRLGQAGGAGGIDIEGPVLGGDARACRPVHRCLRKRGQRRIQILHIGICAALDPLARRSGKKWQRLCGMGRQLGTGDQMPGPGNFDGMGQGLAALIGVDQRHRQAGLQQPQPAAKEIRAVLHEQRHAIALFQSLGDRPMSIGIGAGIERAIVHRLVEIIDGGRLGRGAGLGLDNIDDGAFAVRLDARQQPQGAQDMAEIDKFAADRGGETHAFLPGPSLCAPRAVRKIGPSYEEERRVR